MSTPSGTASHMYGKKTAGFAKWERLLSPDQFQIVQVSTSRGITLALLFPKTIIEEEWKADAQSREAMAIRRARLRAKRASIERPNRK
jgi:hypothetical protein